jgi:hypothetical protein
LFDPSLAASDPRAAAINEATTKLNCVIKQAVADSQATYANIYYGDVTQAFAENSIGCTNCTLFIYPAGPEAFHPTDDGYKAYADAIKTKLPNGWLGKPSP